MSDATLARFVVDDDEKSIKALVEERWLGTPHKHGLRANYHCLAWMLDP